MLWLLVFPANCPTLFNTLKVNVGLSWVGVIMGEFLFPVQGWAISSSTGRRCSTWIW